MSYLENLKEATNFAYTANGAATHHTTMNAVLDMFAQGGAYRARSEADCINLFKLAAAADMQYALKCLFYLRDRLEGQGERRFFRVCFRWLAKEQPDIVEKNLANMPFFGRWDDLYCLVDTPVEEAMFRFMKQQLALDIQSETPSLMGKWLKSCNTSSKESRKLGNKTREAFGMTQKQYRKTLSMLRSKINILETLMSQNRWDEIEFDKIPSKAGFIYRNAFARHDVERMQAAANIQSYADFAKDKTTKVNANVLYPVDIAHKAMDYRVQKLDIEDTERLMIQKYWDNQKDWYNGREERGIAVVDVSGSMSGVPMEAAISLGAYIAERGNGPFKDHFITFSADPELVHFSGVDIVDKINRAEAAHWGMNTNIEKVFDLLLNTALENECVQDELPERLYILSDQEFDNGCLSYGESTNSSWYIPNPNNIHNHQDINTLLEKIAIKWQRYGYKLPSVIFWNLRSAQNNIPAIGDGFSYVSGYSPSIMEAILSGKDGIDLMLDKLNSERYDRVIID